MSNIVPSTYTMTALNVDLTQPVSTNFLLGTTRFNETFIAIGCTIEITSLGSTGTLPSISLGTVAGSYTDVAAAQPLTGPVGPITPGAPPYQVTGINTNGSPNFVSIQAQTAIYLQISLLSTVTPCTANITLLGISYNTV